MHLNVNLYYQHSFICYFTHPSTCFSCIFFRHLFFSYSTIYIFVYIFFSNLSYFPRACPINPICLLNLIIAFHSFVRRICFLCRHRHILFFLFSLPFSGKIWMYAFYLVVFCVFIMYITLFSYLSLFIYLYIRIYCLKHVSFP